MNPRIPRGVIAGVLALLLAPAASAADVMAAALQDPARPAADLERDARDRPAAVLALFGAREGMFAADLFAGGGYYTEILSRVAGPSGRVYAQNNQAYLGFIDGAMDRRLAAGRLPNVVALRTEADALGLPDGQLDMILMVMSLHDVFWVGERWPAIDGDAFAAQLHRALKPGGVLGVVDHAAAAGSGTDQIDALHRIEEAWLTAWLEARGFRLDGSSDVLRNPDDDLDVNVFDPAIRGRTDRFVLRFVRE